MRRNDRVIAQSLWRRAATAVLHVADVAKRDPAVLRNFLALGFIQVTNYGLPILTMPYLVRTLGIANYGLLAFAQSLGQYCKLIIDYGFDLSATRTISLAQDDLDVRSRAFSNVLWIRLALALACLALLSAVVGATDKLRFYWDIHLLTFVSAFASALSSICFYQGIERMEYITYLYTASRLIITASIFLFVRSEADYYKMPIINGVTELALNLAGLWFARRRFGFRLHAPALAELRRGLSEGWHPFVSWLFQNSYTAARTFALGLFNSESITGRFVLAARLSEICQMFPLASLLQAIYPRLSRMYEEDPRRAFAAMRRFQLWTTIAYTAGIPVAMLLAGWVIRLVAKQEFPETLLSLRLLLAGVWIINLNAFRMQFLLVSKRYANYSRLQLVAGTAGSILLFAGSWAYSYVGVAVSLNLVSIYLLLATMQLVKPPELPDEPPR
ncbi:MAG TPA: oligosaccharide flippase family protein [Bryobacteraceae bacterium]|nr:oligosaccharide flippase family protein [Bryobacteraceae bacterium]